MSVKIKRIASEIEREVSRILILEAKNDVLKHVTVTGCEVTNDLSFAYIYYTYMGEKTREEVDLELKKAEKYLRTVLANSIDVRHTPVLVFKYDESIEYGANIERIIKEIHEKDKKREEN